VFGSNELISSVTYSALDTILKPYLSGALICLCDFLSVVVLGCLR